MHVGRFRLDMGNNLFSSRVVRARKHWLPRKVVESASPEIFKTCLDVFL